MSQASWHQQIGRTHSSWYLHCQRRSNRLTCSSAVAATPGLAAWGLGGEGNPATLATFVVRLDERFLTQLAHTGANFADLFPREPRKQLVKVRTFGPRRYPRR